MHLYNFDLSDNSAIEINTSTEINITDSNERQMFGQSIVDFKNKVMYYAYNGVYKLSFDGDKECILEGSYYGNYGKASGSTRYLPLKSSRDGTMDYIYDITINSLVDTSDKKWFDLKPSLIFCPKQNRVVAIYTEYQKNGTVTILDYDLNEIATIDVDSSVTSGIFGTYVKDGNGVTTKTNGILLCNGFGQCAYINFDTNNIVYGLTNNSIRQYSGLVPVAGNDTFVTAVSLLTNHIMTMIPGDIDTTSNILLYKDNNCHKPTLYDFNNLTKI